jgi:hypothetical protein
VAGTAAAHSLGLSAVIVQRPALVAADPRQDALFAARSAYRRAVAMRDSATLQCDQLKVIVERLEAEARG